LATEADSTADILRAQLEEAQAKLALAARVSKSCDHCRPNAGCYTTAYRSAFQSFFAIIALLITTLLHKRFSRLPATKIGIFDDPNPMYTHTQPVLIRM
jgi:hypothetical protein